VLSRDRGTRIAVIGATGWLGAQVVAGPLARGHEV
jgi:putative NADH-flavin reductase